MIFKILSLKQFQRKIFKKQSGTNCVLCLELITVEEVFYFNSATNLFII